MDIGSLVTGAAIALLSAWLASLAAEKKRRREQRGELLKLIGQHQALEHRWKREGLGNKSPMEKSVEWLEKEKPTSATVALAIGYLQQGNKEGESLI